MENSKEQTEKLLTQHSMGDATIKEVISRAMDESLNRIIPLMANEKIKDPLSDYIPKAAIRGKLLSSSTLWKHEKNGNLTTYAIGGKRYYLRSQLENLIQVVKR